MAQKCSRWEECESFEQKGDSGCEGCGFKHFDKILKARAGNETLKSLGEEYFILCSKGKRERGGRKALDKPLKDLFRRRLPKSTSGLSSREEELPINGERVLFKLKFDGGFEVNGKYIFYEVKGYGDNTNDVLSAITAAQLLKAVPKYHDSIYYYIGVSSGKKGNEAGLQRKDFQDPKRTKIYPYVRWAEKNGFLKFFGIADIEDLLREVEETVDK
jgi:hypothetical protein